MSYYSVAEENRQKAEKEFKKEANELVSSLLEKVLISGKGFDNVGIKVDAEDVYYYEANKATEHNFSPGIVDKINTAFTTPQDLKGSVSVGANNEVVFFASNGELLLDAISLTDSQERTKLEEKFLTLDIEKIISSWATSESVKDKNRPIDEQEMGIFYLIPIGKDLSLHYAGKSSGMFSEQKEFMYVNHNEKTIFTPEGFTKDATEGEVNYLKNQLYQVKDITQLSHDVVRLRHSVKTMLSRAGETDKENVLNYDSPKFKISENSEQWLSVTSKESGKEIFNNFGFTQNVNENDKKELQKIEQFMSEWEHGSFSLPEVEVETEDMDFDMGY